MKIIFPLKKLFLSNIVQYLKINHNYGLSFLSKIKVNYCIYINAILHELKPVFTNFGVKKTESTYPLVIFLSFENMLL